MAADTVRVGTTFSLFSSASCSSIASSSTSSFFSVISLNFCSSCLRWFSRSSDLLSNTKPVPRRFFECKVDFKETTLVNETEVTMYTYFYD